MDYYIGNEAAPRGTGEVQRTHRQQINPSNHKFNVMMSSMCFVSEFAKAFLWGRVTR